MAVKPTVYPQFAVDDLNNGTAGAPNVVEPLAAKKLTGWNEGERPPRETYNWLHRITNDWIEWFDQELGTGGINGYFAELPALHSGLQFFCAEATFNFGGEQFTEVQTATTMTDNNTNYVYYDHNTLDVEHTLGGFPGRIDTIPLFIVTTVAGAITNVIDSRTWATMASLATSLKDTHQIRTAGNAETRVEMNAADSTPTPDCALGNHFSFKPTGATNTIQPPINAEVLNATQQAQTITIAIENGSGETTSFSSTNFVLLNDFQSINSLSTVLGEGYYLVTLTYDPDGTGVWYGTVAGGNYNVSAPLLKKYKPDSETKSVTGVADDADLAGFVLIPGIYRVKGFLNYGVNGSNLGIDLNWANTGTITNDQVWVTSTRTANGSPDLNEMGVFFITNGSDLTLPDNGIVDTMFAQIDGTFEVTATTTIDLQWAPVAASGLTMLAGSWIEFDRLGDT